MPVAPLLSINMIITVRLRQKMSKNDTVLTVELFLMKDSHFSDFTGYRMLGGGVSRERQT